MQDDNSDAAVREQCIRLLARREHSRQELRAKLTQRDYDRDVSDRVLDELAAERLLSDERFTEQFVRQRLEAGYGPVKIRADLAERGIAGDLAAPQLDLGDDEWRERCHAAWERRFGAAPRDRQEWGKQARFLANRGFSGDHVTRVLAQVSESDDNTL